MILFAVGLAFATDYSMPTTDVDLGNYVVSAYRDHGGADWACGSNYYSGHRGTDLAIYGGFSKMYTGVDITAAADGVVTYTNDGEYDECTSGACGGGGGGGNYVALQHADGQITYYFHMRTWSVSVSAGQRVSCGEKLGEVGSSGNSTGAHLHFEPRAGGVSFDPFVGSCSSGSSSWVDQGAHNGLPGMVCANVDQDGDGFTEDDGDCNDENAGVYPGAYDSCDGVDTDCNGGTDDGNADGDPATACADCDDHNPRAYPGAPELCDGVDESCDGVLDEGYDEDADGYRTCDGDCEDDDPAVHPYAAETADDLDNDCDWRVDEGTTEYDDDGDGWTEAAGDCDDGNAFSWPGAEEKLDGWDSNCDGEAETPEGWFSTGCDTAGAAPSWFGLLGIFAALGLRRVRSALPR